MQLRQVSCTLLVKLYQINLNKSNMQNIYNNIKHLNIKL